MIDLFFDFLGDVINVKISGADIRFSNISQQTPLAPIDQLKLNYNGVCKEFPDLETNPDWRKIAIQRFKEKIKSFRTEDEISVYIIEDLTKFGYLPKKIAKGGFRTRNL